MMQLKATVSLSQLAEVIKALSKEEREILEMKLSGEEELFKTRVREMSESIVQPVLFQGILCHPEFHKELEDFDAGGIEKIKETARDSLENLKFNPDEDGDVFKNVFILDFVYGKKKRQLFIMLAQEKAVLLMAREEGVLTRL